MCTCVQYMCGIVNWGVLNVYQHVIWAILMLCDNNNGLEFDSTFIHFHSCKRLDVYVYLQYVMVILFTCLFGCSLSHCL